MQGTGKGIAQACMFEQQLVLLSRNVVESLGGTVLLAEVSDFSVFEVGSQAPLPNCRGNVVNRLTLLLLQYPGKEGLYPQTISWNKPLLS